jgi:protocatechuate 3,4-dioxygenase, alpha subunit
LKTVWKGTEAFPEEVEPVFRFGNAAKENFMPQQLSYLKETPSQTAGPYVHIGLAPGAAGFDIYKQELGWDIAGPNAKGERIRIEGIVIDGTGSPVKDVLLEAWQANAEGIHAHPEDAGEVEEGFRGWGRVITDFDTGEWAFETVKPGRVMGRNVGPQAPHINLWIVARGINIGLNTRIYFDDETEANAVDPVLNLIEWERRRATLVARREDRDGKTVYRFDIRLQGEDETVFFDI